MQDIDRIEICLLTESDIPAAMKLKEAAGWNQTEDDWRSLLRLEPQGCFGAKLDGQLVGTTTTTTYADELAWVGMVLVLPESRRLGIATALMTRALEYLNERVATVKLDATALGKPVYEKIGFQVESLVERWSGIAKATTLVNEESEAVAAFDSDTRRELLELDRHAFNADRSKLIEALIENGLVPPVLVRAKDGSLSGYALARRGSNAAYVGPVVARDPDQVGTLLDRMLSQLKEKPVYIDFNTVCSSSPRVLVDRGFVKERDLIRMASGMPGRTTSSLVVAIAGPEVG